MQDTGDSNHQSSYSPLDHFSRIFFGSAEKGNETMAKTDDTMSGMKDKKKGSDDDIGAKDDEVEGVEKNHPDKPLDIDGTDKKQSAMIDAAEDNKGALIYGVEDLEEEQFEDTLGKNFDAENGVKNESENHIGVGGTGKDLLVSGVEGTEAEFQDALGTSDAVKGSEKIKTEKHVETRGKEKKDVDIIGGEEDKKDVLVSDLKDVNEEDFQDKMDANSDAKNCVQKIKLEKHIGIDLLNSNLQPFRGARHQEPPTEDGSDSNNNCVMEDSGLEKTGSFSKDVWDVVPNEDKESTSVFSMSCDEFSFESESEDNVDEPDASKAPKNQNRFPPKEFDIGLLQDCMARGEESLRQIEGKDVVLIVGKTGTGKSTLIQGIAGKTFVMSSYSCGSERCYSAGIKDVFDAGDPVPGFDIGHAKSSKTKIIKCYVHDVDDGEPTYYLDTPGFEDTDGEEVDIATSAMLAQVAQKCRSMRFVILIHYVSLLEDRGGAMRSTLKFMRNFVSDFEKSKKSFMFLFSHSDEIKDIPESLEEANMSLLNEINLTIEGTRVGDGARDLLKFMRMSLKKGYAFVNILHPLKTDFSETTKFIEQKMQRIKTGDRGKRDKTASCILTNLSQMRLIGAVRSLLVNLKMAFRADPVNIKLAIEIQKSFEFFERYIQFTDMRDAIAECNHIFDGHVKYLWETLEKEVRMGTTSSAGSLFNEVNAAVVKDTLSQLKAINPPNFDLTAECDRITQLIDEFQKSIIFHTFDDFQRDTSFDFHGLSENLGKLHAWSVFDAMYKGAFFDPVITNAEAIVESATARVAVFQMKNLVCSTSTEIDALQGLLLPLAALKSIDENARSLSLYLESVSAASTAYNDFLQKLKSELKEWDTMLSAPSGKRWDDIWDLQHMEKLGALFRSLKMVSELIGQVKLRDDLMVLANSVQGSLASLTIENYAAACSEVKEDCYHEHGILCQKLNTLRDAMSTISQLDGRQWNEIESHNIVVIDGVRSFLKAEAGKLKEMSQNAQIRGIVCGKTDGRALNEFAQYIWFDDFLPENDCFVQNCTAEIRSTYHKIFSLKFDIINTTLTTVATERKQPGNTNFLSVMIKVKGISLEILQCARFGSVTEDKELEGRLAHVFADVCEYLSNRMSSWKDALALWIGLVSDTNDDWEKITESTRALDLAISEVNEAIDLPTDICGEDFKAGFHSVKDEIITAFSEFRNDARPPQLNMTYSEIALLLSRAQALTGDFRNAAPYLPSFEDLKEAARKRIMKDIQKIEEMVEQTSDYDTIDDLLREFEKLTVLDEFFSEEVRAFTRLIQRLRKKKEGDADAVLTTMIEKNDFSGLGNFLQPLAKSKNQIRKLKFQKSIEKILKSLKVIDGELQRQLKGKLTEEKMLKFASCMTILEQADHEARDLLPKSKVYDYKAEINRKVCHLQDKLRNSITRADFQTIAIQNYRTELISRHLVQYLSNRSKCMMERNRLELLALKSSVSSCVEKFTKSFFRESVGVQKILDGLKPTTQKSAPIYKDLSQLYSRNTKVLAEKVKEELQNTKMHIEKHGCYDDGIVFLDNFLMSFEIGMHRHLPEGILDESKLLLEKWTEALREQESSLNVEGDSVQIKRWAETLDSLHDVKFFWCLTDFITGQKRSLTYERIRKALDEQVQSRYRSGCEALIRRNFVRVNDSTDFIGLVDSIAAKHLQSASTYFRELKEKIGNTFLFICERSRAALGAKDCREFEQLFGDFRGFVLNITWLMEFPKASANFHLINQLVSERLSKTISSLEKTLDGFKFIEIKRQVEDARQFGGFVADRYSLFHEELNGCSHIETDDCLEKLKSKITKHFQNGRDLKNIKNFARLGVVPSASLNEVNHAYRMKALAYHPDKCKDEDAADKFRMVKYARDELNTKFLSDVDRLMKPFDDEVRGLGDRLRNTTRQALNEQDYGLVEYLLFKLIGIHVLDDLVSPKLDTGKIRDSVTALVRNHVQKVRIEINTNWSERKYEDLNDNIKDIKMMEEKFKSHESVFSTSWNTGIIEEIKLEIEKLGVGARDLLKEKKTALDNRDEFRRCFMEMGAVLVELPLFKDHTKKVMSDILESCINVDWGYGFVFDLGLNLSKGSDMDSEQEARIAQNLLNEFGCFKEVLTMVWNEEIVQKPPEDTIRDIVGQLLKTDSLDSSSIELNVEELLKQYLEFNAQYTSFLGEYLNPDADLNRLVQNTISCCGRLKPINCDDGFGPETKLALPTIMAGVFTLFTVLKSGDSFNRFLENSNEDGSKADMLLMKPHNIQVLTLFCMFGCGVSQSTALKSQLLQIRTGEGKSIILGAAATILGLLGFRVRCICYSEYLSSRDYDLFHDIFHRFGLLPSIKYCKITTLSEESTAAKGNIRDLTLSLLHQSKPNSRRATGSMGSADTIISNVISAKALKKGGAVSYTEQMNTGSSNHAESNDISTMSQNVRETTVSISKELANTLHQERNEYTDEIILVDEVDVFFGPEFYGQTYDQVAELNEPEVATILKRIWELYKQRKRPRLADIKAMPEYRNLMVKIPSYGYVIDNEIALMLDQVRRVDDEPCYYLDRSTDSIGYKVQDTICYNVTYGYRTVFAYLKEGDNLNLKDRNATLSRVLTMPLSCGQFSYANIKPKRILGVSGTLEVMNDYEKRVLMKYGVNQYLFIPSVYAKSNSSFDKAGDGVAIEQGISDFFHRISKEISIITTKQNRAAIVFFKGSRQLKEFVSSAFYRKLGRKKEILTEDLSPNEKSFVINKAATAGQVTICSAVFGRGTDFFCKDETLEKNGGVHVIQTFLSTDLSEEIQIRGRTARQGKQGSYQLVLLDSDLEDEFGISCGSTDNWPKKEMYSKLCSARKKHLEENYSAMEANLSAATQQDKATHRYFDALLRSNNQLASSLFKDLYQNMKANGGQMDLDLAFAIDITGSMTAYRSAIETIMANLLTGSNSITTKLQDEYPYIKFKLRAGVLGYRDIDDGKKQYEEMRLPGGSHFSDDLQQIYRFVESITSSSSGGGDIAEDHLGAMQRCLSWGSTGDWEGAIKALLLLTDAPAHGYSPYGNSMNTIDNYDVRHSRGVTVNSVVEKALEKGVDLILCSFDPVATEKFEEEISNAYLGHESNVEEREVTLVPLVPKTTIGTRSTGSLGDSIKHNIFVLDESGSMENDWPGVVSVYNKYLHNRRQRQHHLDLVSVVQFAANARVICELENIADAPVNLDFSHGGTEFGPAAELACTVARKTPSLNTPVIIFMSDGCANDSAQAASAFAKLNEEMRNLYGDIELHVIGFGGGTDSSQLQEISRASAKGRVHTADDIDSLTKVFVEIADGDAVASALEEEIGKRISDAVTDRISAEYLG